MIVVNDDYRLIDDGRVKEGGLSRNEAIIKWLRNNSTITEAKLCNGRIVNMLYVLRILITKKDKILFFYPTVGIPILKNGLLGRMLQTLFFFIVRISSKRNQILFDICDLKYEQAIDLSIDKERLEAIKRAENLLFALECKYIFT